MSGVEFGDGREPCSVARGKVKRYTHVLVRDVTALPSPWRAELRAWLADRGVTAGVRSALVTRDAAGGGHRVHVQGAALDVEFAELPVWLRERTPEPVKPSRKAAARGAAGDDV